MRILDFVILVPKDEPTICAEKCMACGKEIDNGWLCLDCQDDPKEQEATQ